MATVGPTICGTGNTRAIGRTAWTNPGNITADDSSYATCVTVNGTDELIGSNFVWTGLTGATITNVLFEIKGKTLSGSYIMTALTEQHSTHTTRNNGSYSISSSEGWTTVINDAPAAGFDADIIANDDGYAIYDLSADADSFSINAMRVTITYTLAATGMTFQQRRTVAVNRAAYY